MLKTSEKMTAIFQTIVAITFASTLSSCDTDKGKEKQVSQASPTKEISSETKKEAATDADDEQYLDPEWDNMGAPVLTLGIPDKDGFLADPDYHEYVDINYGDKPIDCKDMNAIIKKAEDGDKDALFKTGIMYFQGDCTSRNLEIAYHWFHGAAMQKHADAYYNVGFMLHRAMGPPTSPEKKKSGFEIIKHLADQGYPLGLAYMNEYNYDENGELIPSVE